MNDDEYKAWLDSVIYGTWIACLVIYLLNPM